MTGAGDRFIIVGGGQAGAWVARTLRSEGFQGTITIFGDEDHRPYSRPPLSKEILAGERNVPGLEFLSIDDAATLRIQVLTNQPIERIDTAQKLVFPIDAAPTAYEKLFITTGSRARQPAWIEGGRSRRLLTLRTLDDALLIQDHLASASSLIVVGGGWIGLEVAAIARLRGLQVTVLEAADRLCKRSAPGVLSEWFLRLHASNDVAIRLSAAVDLAYEVDGVVKVRLSTGELLTGDVCVVGAGNVPNIELAEHAGLKVDNGLVVDAFCQTSDPFIYAAGDVTNFPCAFSGRRVRRESWAHAQNQAVTAAKSALGAKTPYGDLPWLWSDQFGHNIQILGRPEEARRWLVRGRPEAGSGTWLALDQDNIVLGAVSINSPKDLRPIRGHLSRGTIFDPAGDWEIPLGPDLENPRALSNRFKP
ncbi:MAG TPA: FAD-dependent oxidoreductase [Caulobacteraceae bacterium]|jgi:3-phenylpropionate/trans-cinnamate dioxygenase ferredoxin reductase subunit|nr:FAD-dependent oxidoreductase [Caulobacteraceae bacterium]